MFKNKSRNYEQYRPNYPSSLISFFQRNKILRKTDLVAEFGCGTGKLTELLLNNGNKVHGVEPEKEMFDLLKEKYPDTANLILTNGSAESSSLSDDTFDLVVVAQAFHLFNAEKAKKEFYRILKPNGIVALIWYHWDMSFEISSEIRTLFYKYGNKQKQQTRLNISREFFRELFFPNKVYHNLVDTIQQKFSKDGFIKSMLSSSYATTNAVGEKTDEYLNELNMIFCKYSKNKQVEYSFNLEVYYSRIENKNSN